MRWMWVGLGAMFVLIGVAAVLGALYPGSSSSPSTPSTVYSDFFHCIWGFVGLFFAIMFLWWIFGGGGPMGWRRYRYRRFGYGDEYQILRERNARGEITREQFDQMTRDLDQHQNQP